MVKILLVANPSWTTVPFNIPEQKALFVSLISYINLWLVKLPMPMRQSSVSGVLFSAYNHLHLAFLIASPLVDSYNQGDWCFSILFIPRYKISSNYLISRLNCLSDKKNKNKQTKILICLTFYPCFKWGLLRSIIIVYIKMISSFCGISAFSYLWFPVLRTSESVEVSQWAVVLAYLLCLAHMFDKMCPCPFTCTSVFPLVLFYMNL